VEAIVRDGGVCATAGASALYGLNNPIGELHAGVVLLRARAAALQHPDYALDAGAVRNRQVRASRTPCARPPGR